MLRAVIPLLVIFMIIGIASPFPYTEGTTSSSHPFILEWGESGISKSGFFSFPQNLAIDDLGNVYVTDLGNMRVQKFNNDGTFLNAWGSSGTGSGQFHSPAGIAVFNGTVFVVDTQLHRVQTFDLEGQFITKWGEEGENQGQFLLPNGIAVGPRGTVYVVDTGNLRIQKFTTDGQFISEFGKSGTQDGEFVSPLGIAIDGEENIFISDPGKNKIFKFDSEGAFLQSYGPNFAGFSMMPRGIAIDSLNNIYVADTGHDRILQLSPEGLTLSSWGSMGIESGQFKNPLDVKLDENGHVFVVDTNGHRIQKFGSPSTSSFAQTAYSSENTEEQQETQTLPPVNPVPGDLTKPVIAPPNDLFIEATGGLTPVSVGQAMATDESGIQSLTNNAPEQFPLGTTTIIWTAIDGAGNMGIATQVITVIDTTPPTIALLPEISIEAQSPENNQIELELPLASDAVGVLSLTNDAPEVFPLGETIVTWTAIDVASNSVSETQKIILIDTTPPNLSAPQDIIFEATSYDQNEIYLGEAVVIDNGEIISITNDAPQFFSIGETVVIWSAADAAGNVVSREQLVSVVDTTAPVLTASEDVIFEATSANENLLELENPTVVDVQDVTISNDAPFVFPLGETVVTWVSKDESGNVGSITQKVNVIDTTPPTLTIPEITIEATGVENNEVLLDDVSAEDATGIFSLTNNAPETFPFGTTVVTWTAMDNFGNLASADQTVTIVDTTPPQITAPADIVIEAVGPEQNYVDLGIPWAFDTIAVESFSNDAPDLFPIGKTVITWAATDTTGNVATDLQIVTVTDTAAPTITPPSDIVVEATSSSGMSLDIGDAASIDAIGVASTTNNAPDLFYVGETIVTWTATDIHGNTASAEQIITVVDTTSPSIETPPDVTIEAYDATSNVVPIGTANAEDNVGVVSLENDAPNEFPIGNTLVTWTASDAAGNVATSTQIVSVTDTTAPTITPPSDIVVEATISSGMSLELGNSTASDEMGIESVTNDAPEVFPVGETIVTWTATDVGGLSSSATQSVNVVDTTPPTISAPKMMTVEATSYDQNIVELGGIYADDLVGVTSIHNDAPLFFPVGLTTITWTASDKAGNVATAIQKISVVDTAPPSITAPEDVVIEAVNPDANTVQIGSAQADDLVSVAEINNDVPEVFPLGETTVTWTAVDSSGNIVTATQTVKIIDTTPPTIETPEDLEVEAISSNENVISLASPYATDSIGEVTISNDAPQFFQLGETIVTWTVTDEAGNSASTSQKVTVIDTTAPELFPPADIIIDASALQTPVVIGEAAARDIADSLITISNDAPFSFPLGQTTVTWKAVDFFGNSISSTQIINVQACGKPDSYYNMILGGPEDDILFGTTVADLIFAEEGDDIVIGSKGNDCIFGGDGDDIIFGNEGADSLSGGNDNDVIKGQSGDDSIDGGFGVDVIDGGDDFDSCNLDQVPDGDLEIKCES